MKEAARAAGSLYARDVARWPGNHRALSAPSRNQPTAPIQRALSRRSAVCLTARPFLRRSPPCPPSPARPPPRRRTFCSPPLPRAEPHRPSSVWTLAAVPAAASPLSETVASVRIQSRDRLATSRQQWRRWHRWESDGPRHRRCAAGRRSAVRRLRAGWRAGVRLVGTSGPQLTSRIGSGRNAVRLAQSGGQLLVIVAGTACCRTRLPTLSTRWRARFADRARPGRCPRRPTAQTAPTVPAAALVASRPSASPSGSPAARRRRDKAARVIKVSGWVAIASDTPIAAGDRLRSQRWCASSIRPADAASASPATSRLALSSSNACAIPSPARIKRRGPRPLHRQWSLAARQRRAPRDLAEPTSDPIREPCTSHICGTA